VKPRYVQFENRMLRRIFGSERDEATGGWRKLHNEELHELCCSRFSRGDTSLGTYM
jgi:hypothetical protein